MGNRSGGAWRRAFWQAGRRKARARPARTVRSRRARPRSRPGKRLGWRLAGLALAAGVMLLLWGGYENLRELAGIYGENQCRNLVTRLMTEAAAESGGGSLFLRERQGEQTILTLDAAGVRQMQAAVGQSLTQKLEDLQMQSHKVTLGTVAGSAFWMDRGPELTLRFVPVGSVQVQSGSGLCSAGINQVLYQVWLDLSVTMTVVAPGGARRVDCAQRVVVEETLITGQVPLAYGAGGTNGE